MAFALQGGGMINYEVWQKDGKGELNLPRRVWRKFNVQVCRAPLRSE